MAVGHLLTLVGTGVGIVLAWVLARALDSGERAVSPTFAALVGLVVLAALDQTSAGLIQRVLGWSIAQVRLVLWLGGAALLVWLIYDETTDDDVRLSLPGR